MRPAPEWTTRNPCRIYFATHAVEPLLKIGGSGNPQERVKYLKFCDRRDDFRLLWSIDADFTTERMIHTALKRFRFDWPPQREFYHLRPKLMNLLLKFEAIKSLRQMQSFIQSDEVRGLA